MYFSAYSFNNHLNLLIREPNYIVTDFEELKRLLLKKMTANDILLMLKIVFISIFIKYITKKTMNIAFNIFKVFVYFLMNQVRVAVPLQMGRMKQSAAEHSQQNVRF